MATSPLMCALLNSVAGCPDDRPPVAPAPSDDVRSAKPIREGRGTLTVCWLSADWYRKWVTWSKITADAHCTWINCEASITIIMATQY